MLTKANNFISYGDILLAMEYKAKFIRFDNHFLMIFIYEFCLDFYFVEKIFFLLQIFFLIFFIKVRKGIIP